MENDIFTEITMQEHTDLFGPVECDECGRAMKPCTHTQVFNLTHQGVKVKVSGIQAHKCDVCGHMLISSMENMLIEMEIRKALPSMKFGNVNNDHTHDYDPHGCCRLCGHLKPGGIAHQEAAESHERRETMDKLILMFHQAEAEFTCNVKNGGECLYHSCSQHKERELARYLVNHGVKLEE